MVEVGLLVLKAVLCRVATDPPMAVFQLLSRPCVTSETRGVGGVLRQHGRDILTALTYGH